jgi:hypothetical protein
MYSEGPRGVFPAQDQLLASGAQAHEGDSLGVDELEDGREG